MDAKKKLLCVAALAGDAALVAALPRPQLELVSLPPIPALPANPLNATPALPVSGLLVPAPTAGLPAPVPAAVPSGLLLSVPTDLPVPVDGLPLPDLSAVLDNSAAAAEQLTSLIPAVTSLASAILPAASSLPVNPSQIEVLNSLLPIIQLLSQIVGKVGDVTHLVPGVTPALPLGKRQLDLLNALPLGPSFLGGILGNSVGGGSPLNPVLNTVKGVAAGVPVVAPTVNNALSLLQVLLGGLPLNALPPSIITGLLQTVFNTAGGGTGGNVLGGVTGVLGPNSPRVLADTSPAQENGENHETHEKRQLGNILGGLGGIRGTTSGGLSPLDPVVNTVKGVAAGVPVVAPTVNNALSLLQVLLGGLPLNALPPSIITGLLQTVFNTAGGGTGGNVLGGVTGVLGPNSPRVLADTSPAQDNNENSEAHEKRQAVPINLGTATTIGPLGVLPPVTAAGTLGTESTPTAALNNILPFIASVENLAILNAAAAVFTPAPSGAVPAISLPNGGAGSLPALPTLPVLGGGSLDPIVSGVVVPIDATSAILSPLLPAPTAGAPGTPGGDVGGIGGLPDPDGPAFPGTGIGNPVTGNPVAIVTGIAGQPIPNPLPTVASELGDIGIAISNPLGPIASAINSVDGVIPNPLEPVASVIVGLPNPVEPIASVIGGVGSIPNPVGPIISQVGDLGGAVTSAVGGAVSSAIAPIVSEVGVIVGGGVGGLVGGGLLDPNGDELPDLPTGGIPGIPIPTDFIPGAPGVVGPTGVVSVALPTIVVGGAAGSVVASLPGAVVTGLPVGNVLVTDLPVGGQIPGVQIPGVQVPNLGGSGNPLQLLDPFVSSLQGALASATGALGLAQSAVANVGGGIGGGIGNVLGGVGVAANPTIAPNVVASVAPVFTPSASINLRRDEAAAPQPEATEVAPDAHIMAAAASPLDLGAVVQNLIAGTPLKGLPIVNTATGLLKLDSLLASLGIPVGGALSNLGINTPITPNAPNALNAAGAITSSAAVAFLVKSLDQVRQAVANGQLSLQQVPDVVQQIVKQLLSVAIVTG